MESFSATGTVAAGGTFALAAVGPIPLNGRQSWTKDVEYGELRYYVNEHLVHGQRGLLPSELQGLRVTGRIAAGGQLVVSTAHYFALKGPTVWVNEKLMEEVGAPLAQ